MCDRDTRTATVCKHGRRGTLRVPRPHAPLEAKHKAKIYNI